MSHPTQEFMLVPPPGNVIDKNKDPENLELFEKESPVQTSIHNKKEGSLDAIQEK